jgi:hypothetical protein
MEPKMPPINPSIMAGKNMMTLTGMALPIYKIEYLLVKVQTDQQAVEQHTSP